MDEKIECTQKILNAYLVTPSHPKSCVLFLSGGSIITGKERFRKWQQDLKGRGIASVAFDYSGVNSSGTPLEESSLEGRIEESICAAEWMLGHVGANHYVLYGVSMGGYIALGLMFKRPEIFEKIILHAPAAYSSDAHSQKFGEQFSKKIRKEKSWRDSLSFNWLRGINKPTLLIEAENDEVVPPEIITEYKKVAQNREYFTFTRLENTGHDIWENRPENFEARRKVFAALSDFILAAKIDRLII